MLHLIQWQWNGGDSSQLKGIPLGWRYVPDRDGWRNVPGVNMKRNYSAELCCGHCERKGLSRVLSEYSERDIETLTSPCGYLVKQSKRPWGVAYILSHCMHCENVTLTRIEWHDNCSAEGYSYTVLYPAADAKIKWFTNDIACCRVIAAKSFAGNQIFLRMWTYF